MSFAKIAEARAVKKIVALLRQRAREAESFMSQTPISVALRIAATDIEEGRWKDIKLPKAEPKKKAKKK